VNDVDSNGMTALMWAAKGSSDPRVISVLLSAGADGKAMDYNGKGAFDYAGTNAKLNGTAAYWALNNAGY
jgi:ankyrin repeat protein